MNEQALLDSYELFKSGGYTKSLEEYKKLIATNPKALNDAYKLFKSKGYNKSIEDFSKLVIDQAVPENIKSVVDKVKSLPGFNQDKVEKEKKVREYTDQVAEEANNIYNSKINSLPKTEFGTIDFDDDELVSNLYKDIIGDFHNTSPIIQKEILPRIQESVKGETLNYANKLKLEMGLDDPNNITQDLIDEYESLVNDFYNKNINAALAKDQEFQAVNEAFNNNIEKIQGPSFKRFVQGKDSPQILKMKDFAESTGIPGLTAFAQGIENMYTFARQITNSLEDTGLKSYLGYQVDKEKSLEFIQGQIDKYADDSVEGVWVTDKQAMSSSWKFIPKTQLESGEPANWQSFVAGKKYSEGTFADFKNALGNPGEEGTYLNDQHTQIGTRMAEVLEKSLILSQYDDDEFNKILAGEDIVSNSIALAAEQLPQMALALVTLGASSAVQIGSDIYAQGIDIEARKRFNIPDTESPTVQQLAEVLKDESFMSMLEAKAVGGGFIAGQLERFGAGKALSSFTINGSKSLLRGSYKNFLKSVANGTIKNTVNGFTEATTEIMQELIQAGASGASVEGEQLFKAGGTGFISSFVLGIGGNVTTQSATEIKTINKIISGKLNPNSSEAFLNNKLKELDLAFKNKEISKEAYEENRNAINNVKKANASIPSYFTNQSKQKALDLLIQKQELSEQIDGKDKSITKVEREMIDDINAELESLSELEKAFNKRETLLQKGRQALFGGDKLSTKTFETKEELEAYLKEQGKDENVAKRSMGQYGTIFQDKKTGKQEILINKEVIFKDGKISTADHEFLHAILYQTVKNNRQAQINMGKALYSELVSLTGGQIKNTEFAARLNGYLNEAGNNIELQANAWEEALTLYAEGLANGEFKVKRSFIEKIKEFFQVLFSKNFDKEIRFDTGADVIKFVRDYNKSFESGKYGDRFKKAAQEGIKGALVEGGPITESKSETKASTKFEIQNQLNVLEDQVMNGEIDYDTYEAKIKSLEEKLVLLETKAEVEAAKPKPKKKKKKESSEESLSDISARSKKILDRIGNDPNGFNPNNPKIYEILDGIIRSKSKVFKTSGGNISNLTKLSDFEMENMVSETLVQLLPWIQKFDPKRNDSLYGYINSQLANKMRQALKSGKVTTGQFTSDVTEQKGLMAEETTTAKEDKPKYTKLIDADIVSADVINTISDKLLSSVRVLRNRLTAAVGRNQNTSPLIAEILSNISRQADIDLKKAMGGKQDGILRKWLLRNKKAIIENLTTTFLMGKDQKGKNEVLGGLPIAIQKKVNGEWLSYPNWVGKEIDRETTEKRGATAGNQIVRRVPANKISDADFLSFFLDSTGNPLRGRKEALAKELAGEIGLELFVEAIQSETGPIFEAFEKNQDILGEVLKDNYIGEINKQVERGTVKFSLRDTSNKLNDLIQKTDEGPVLDYLNAASLNLNKLNEDASPEQIINALLPEFKKELFNKALSKLEIRALRLETLRSLIKNDVVDYVEIAGAIPAEVERFIYQQKEIAAEVAFKQLEKDLSKANEENKKRILFEFTQLYSRAIRGSKILGITTNQKLYDKLAEIAGEDIVKNTFDVVAVSSGKTLVFKVNSQPVSPFTSTPLLKAEAEAMLTGEDFEMEWERLSNKTRVESAIARSLIVDFIKDNIKIYGKQAVKKQLLLLYGDQSSIVRKLSYWSGVEQSLIGKSGVKTVVEHALEAKTIFDALIDFVDNNSEKKLNKVFEQATINLISVDSDKKLKDTKAKNKDRYNKAGINLIEAAEMSYDDIINKTIVLGHSVNTTIKYSQAADPELLNKEFNLMLERKTGMRANEKISKARAEQLGKGKGRFDLFLPPNAEDFQGLLYKFLGEGKQGDADFAFLKEYLLDPFDVAENAMSSFRQRLAENLKQLRKELGDIDKDISNETIKKIEATGFTPDQAVRIFIWNRQGNNIPNLTAKEKAALLSVVRRDPSLMRYAKELMRITEQFGGYPPASDSWYAGNSTSDLYQYANENVRAKFLENWQANADAIFNKDNLIKLEALYGKDFVKNLKDVLRRMKSGSNRPLNMDDSASAMLDYINGSVGTIMFLNIRSAVLQTISSVNFLNWHDNNLFAAGKTLANPKNFIKTFMEVMNSDFLKQRRDGLEINVSEAEIASAMERSKNKAKALFSALIKFGYKPTQFADSFAIAIGGTPFLINRTNAYIKSGLDPKTAREKAFTDFRAIAEENQQSSRTDRTSNIQASTQGRLLFAFNNTPFQMTRIMKKAVLDLVNRRGDTKTNISKIIYYGAIQNILFYSLQQASMAVLFGLGDDEEDEKKQKTAKEKRDRLLNSVLDGILRGSGLPGAIISTAKNVILEYYVQDAKDPFVQDHGKTIIAALNFSPPLGSKASRIYTGLKGKKFEKTIFDAIKNKSKIAAAITNIPVDRMVTKIDNMRVAVNQPIEDWKRLALLAGWDQWSLGVYEDLKAIEEANTPNNTGKSRSQIMKEVWDKKKAEDKAQRIKNLGKLKGKL